MNSLVAVCDFAGPQFLLFNDIPTLVYLSHIPIFIAAFFVGVFVLQSSSRNLQNRAFFLAMLAFGTWVFLDSVFWAANRSDVIMFVWSMLVFVEPIVHLCMLYLVYLLSTGKDMPFAHKLAAVAIFAPQFLFVPTTFTLSGFDLANCLPNEVFFSYYSYTIEIIFILWITFFGLRFHRKENNAQHRREMAYLTSGIVLFLVSFTGGNIYGTITDDWNIGAIGLFGMIILSVFFAYSIVRFQTFNIKVISTQVLVTLLFLLSGSQVFFADTTTNLILTIALFILVVILGTILVFAVKKEVQRKEELEVLAKELSAANAELKRLDGAKSEFISIASHQLRTPLTAIRGFLELLLEGAYGTLEPKVKETMGKLTVANNRLMGLVENLLNISRIEAGRIQYQFAPTRIENVVDELADMFALAAKEKSLAFKVLRPTEPLPLLSLDAAKIREVVSNLIDNAIKYTEKGSVTVSYEERAERVAVIVTDTGIGIDPADLPHLFKKFERGSQASRVNVSSTGLGLYVGRKFAEAHGGTVTAESEGKGHGARFVLELPVHVVEYAKRLSKE